MKLHHLRVFGLLHIGRGGHIDVLRSQQRLPQDLRLGPCQRDLLQGLDHLIYGAAQHRIHLFIIRHFIPPFYGFRLFSFHNPAEYTIVFHFLQAKMEFLEILYAIFFL